MQGLSILGSMIASSPVATGAVAIVGSVGGAKKIYNYVKGNQKQDSLNNKIQSIVATIFLISVGSFLSTISPAFLFFGIANALVINTPHIAKLFTKDKQVKERLDNIAGVIAAFYNIFDFFCFPVPF